MIPNFTRKWLLLVCVVCIASAFSSCDKDDAKTEENNTHVNNWILENMEVFYLWNDKIPSKTDKTLYPSDYFETLLSDEDRFSWIQDNYTDLLNALSGVTKEAGYDFKLMKVTSTDPEVIGYITYVKPQSPAVAASLKRGDWFLTINGEQLTVDNYGTLLGGMGAAHKIGIVDWDTETIQEVSVDVTVYEENPLLLDTIYTMSEDKKVGYFVYNFFARDNGDGSMAYEKELNQMFGKFKEAAIDELIIDLRYNGGGAVITAQALASMVSGVSTSKVFGITQYNEQFGQYLRGEYGADYNKSYFIDALKNEKGTETVPIHKLGLGKLYVLTSERTASASELLVNALTPFMEVVMIGGVTVGKNVGSITIYEENPERQKTNKWGIQPIVAKFANSVGFSDYGYGFQPKIFVREDSTLNDIKPLGDVNELVLRAALNDIAGLTPAKTRAAVRTMRDPIGSSANRMPVRQNMYITLPKR
ncbi:MAG: hypothetical protein LBS03_03240 [Bacteroidales bacterium]|jgi:C-terminal processing protease CtpA/Prc|nr:hypothetical protein [Bacteroidales bacterium]